MTLLRIVALTLSLSAAAVALIELSRARRSGYPTDTLTAVAAVSGMGAVLPAVVLAGLDGDWVTWVANGYLIAVAVLFVFLTVRIHALHDSYDLLEEVRQPRD